MTGSGGRGPGRPPLPRRARWIALRTFRHRVEPTGDTVEGSPVYLAGSTRLVLPEGVHHFRRLRACALCGREMIGRPVLDSAGLEARSAPHMCEACSTGGTGVPEFAG